ncbi:MAG TPA: hypothetical protein VNS32_23220, partial [Flavisolibacter sp.]|nr:hypothetical protein [Flavisolibacter sp.]
DAVLNRWTSPGHSGTYQLFSQSPVSAATAASQLMYNSSAILTDASFVRLKTLSLSYALPQRWMKRTHLETGKLFLQAQNLWTLTSYQGADPESQNPTALPPLKMISLGIQIIL